MFRAFAFAISFAAFAGPVAAACPTVADLDRGVSFTLSDGTKEVFRRLDRHKIESIWTDLDGSTTRNVLAKGIYLVDVGDVVNGKLQSDGRSITKFPVSDAKLPGATPGTKWTVNVVAKEDTGTINSKEEYVFGSERSYTIGGCDYSAVPIKLTYLDLPRGNFDEYIWINELGVSVVIKESFGVGDVDTYRYTSVEAVK